ncbi:MAG: hypothetical protein ABIK85_01520 [Candidatus Eisenbacteria bacterium]
MKTLVCIAVSVLLLSAPAADARGFGGGPGRGPSPDFWGDLDFAPVVGHWAEYQMTPKGEKPMTMRISIVGEEDDAYWYEMVMTGEKGEKMISKMLVSGDPQDTENIKRMIVKSGDEPAMEMPIQMMAMMGGMEEVEGELPETTTANLGSESVTVPAGTFDANHWQFTSEDVVFNAWVMAGVGPYGVVKSASDEFEMVLVAHGDKAATLITETPQALPMPGFPMPGKGGK